MKNFPRTGPSVPDRSKILECIWMHAGVVDYKLCDREYECETCPFDRAIRDRDGATEERRSREPDRILVRLPDSELETHGECLVSPDLFYQKGHVWARVEAGGQVRVGLDDFGQRLLGPVYSVRLPAVGARVDRSLDTWGAVGQLGKAELAFPVGGLIREVNERLVQWPSWLNRDPYGQGASVLIRPRHLARSLKRLYYGEQAVPWFRRELQRLDREVARPLLVRTSRMGQTLPDGGHPIQDLFDLVRADARSRRRGLELFLSRPDRGKPRQSGRTSEKRR